ncbi:hypothetical protein M011DRAFT_472863 [Sporormia fimetaria CBS 119925]|uniref:S-adenosyl-L-methionine-dependent methyltransferase n=1 Tax=Sporormia fimetaria CBS 119925 TaxID=1340428 RepID=A0A6A6UX76_9PLEO|nr:hypothetical protein M011DRAFT_472863 [Sporormia fimetaria CBS 119925]
MNSAGRCLSPTSSLRPVRSLTSNPEEHIAQALNNLHRLYCPLRVPISLLSKAPHASHLVDSGYASRDEEEDQSVDAEEFNSALRADRFERDFAIRWLTSFIARADELPFESDDTRISLVEEAAFILSSFSDASDEDTEEALIRDFEFPTTGLHATDKIEVRLNDAPLSGTDHTDVGLQSWGASIILSGRMCESPSHFDPNTLPSEPLIVELGAGTGLVSLTLAKLLPQLEVMESTIVATDYHPAVLENLHANISTNFPSHESLPVKTALLDWSAPSFAPPLDKPADMLVAADVIYAPEHARWLRDCAGLLLAPAGVFWLMVTVRSVGKFEGIPDTVETAFSAADAPRRGDQILKILSTERLEKQRGIGRGDEQWYNLYRIGWA